MSDNVIVQTRVGGYGPRDICGGLCPQSDPTGIGLERIVRAILPYLCMLILVLIGVTYIPLML